MALPANWSDAAHEVLRLQRESASQRDDAFTHMNAVKDLYNGDTLVALPEIDAAERPAVANLIMMGINEYSMRVASVDPEVSYPVIGNTQAALDRAERARRAALGWWEMNRHDMLQRRRARHLTAYGMTVVSVAPIAPEPSDKRRIPFWRVRNPLATFLPPMDNPDALQSPWAIFRDRKPLSWFEKRYPSQVSALFRGDGAMIDMIEILEYADDKETCFVAVGQEQRRTDQWGNEYSTGLANVVTLDRIPNRVGIVPVVVAGRITLDRLQGRYDQTIGMYQRQAKLDALNTIAIYRNVFADEWAFNTNAASRPNVIQRADGKRGIIGILEGGEMTAMRPPMNQDIPLALDRLERSIRLTGSTPAGWGGEANTNVRTARQGADLIASMVDMDLQEDQALLASAAEVELFVASKMMKAYYGASATSFYFGMDGVAPRKDYVPDETFVSDAARVKYSLPGTDLAGMTVTFGQMAGMGEMSLQTMRELDPRIPDAVREKERVEIEAVEKAFMASIEQQAGQGAISPVDIARVITEMRSGKPLYMAFMELDAERRKTQADQANAAATQTQATPEAQPGVMAPAGAPPTPAPAANQAQPQDLGGLLAQLGGQSAGSPGAQYTNQTDIAPAPAPAGV